MANIYVFITDGNEETELVAPVDLLRRAGNTVTLVSASGRRETVGANGIRILADKLLEDEDYLDGDVYLVPGGLPGAEILGADSRVTDLLKYAFENGKHVGAICASPALVLAPTGILNGKKAICYPGCEGALNDGGATVEDMPAVTDGNVTTGKGPGAAIRYGLELVRIINGEQAAAQLRSDFIAI